MSKTEQRGRTGTSPITARMPVDLVRRLDRQSEKLGVSRSELICRILRHGVADMEQLTSRLGSPLGRMVLRFAASIETDEEVAVELRRIADHLREQRRRRGEDPLPGLEGL